MIDATTTPKNKQTVTKQTVESNMYYSNYRQLISDLSMQQQIHNFKMMQKHLTTQSVTKFNQITR